MSSVQVQLLGGFQLIYDDQPVTSISQTRQQSLLAYLLLRSSVPQSRKHVAFLFWPDSTERQARANLRYILHQLRRSLPDAERYLYVDARTLQWRPDDAFRLDVTSFENAVARADEAQDRQTARTALEEAVELYGGSLLPGCYDEWIWSDRDRLNQRFINSLEQLVALCSEQADYAAAIDYAQRLLRHDPVNEATYRRLMQLHALDGDRARALSVYHTCTTVLEQELDVEPSPATQEVYRQLVNQEWPPDAGRVRSRAPGAPASTRRLVGRNDEWEQLQVAWRAAMRGGGHFVLISGEAGIGKTHLAEELLLWAGQRAVSNARTRAYAAEGSLAYAPVTEWLRSEACREHLPRMDDVWASEVARLLPEMFVARPDLMVPQPMTENWQRLRLFEALARAVLIGNQPLLLHIDDLQWCDQETLEWLHYLLRFAADTPLLVVGAMRPEEISVDYPLEALLEGLRGAGQLTEIELRRLDREETAALASTVAEHELDETTLAQLYEETEGVPLFVVETVRAGFPGRANGSGLQEASSAPLAPGSRTTTPLPPKVYVVIQSRLNQLSPPARDLASLAAVIGRSFTFDVLAEVSNSDEDALVQGLDELWRRRFIREQGANAYDFGHDRIRDVAYAQISPAQRLVLQRRVAQALENLHAADLDRVSGRVAAHWELAGQIDRAVDLYHRAGETAQRVYANAEAINHFKRGLGLLADQPRAPSRDRLELELLAALGVSLVEQKGYAADEARETYQRALTLCRRTGQPDGAPVLRALAISCVARNELSQAHEYGHQLLSLAERDHDPVTRVEAHYVLGVTAFWQGAFDESREHLEQAIARYDPSHHATHIARYAQDPKVICLCRLAFVQWCLGYPDQALKTSQKAVVLAKATGHPFSQAYVFAWTALLHNQRRDVESTLHWAAATIELSVEHGLPFWLGIGEFLKGWALTVHGEIESGIAQMQAGCAAFRATGSDFLGSYFSTLMALFSNEHGNGEQGLATVDEALAFVQNHGERWCEAEMNRVKGEMLLARGSDPGQVEASFRRAMDIAREQHARSLELRAAVNLGHLWQERGAASRAHDLLAGIYDWFSEGFDTADLKEARALLEALSAEAIPAPSSGRS